MAQEAQQILHATFNQDATCLAVATRAGFRIFNTETGECCYEERGGAISLVEMLYSTSLLAVVGAGEQPALSPRRVSILNTAERSVIADLYFRSAVLAVRLSRARLVVVQSTAVAVYALATLQALESIPTVPNPRGVVALSQCAARPLLALPGAAGEGVVLVRDAGGSGHTLCELHAHRTPLAALAFSADGLLLASASEKGTVVRLHALPSAEPFATLRRGLAPAGIASLAFGPRTAGPPLVVASSDSGTVHVFRVDPPGAAPHAAEAAQELAGRSATARATAAAAAACSAAAGAVVATLLPRLPRRLRRPVRDTLEAQRAAVTVRLGGSGTPAGAAGSAAAAAAAGITAAAAASGGMLGLTSNAGGGPACRAVVALAPPRANDADGQAGAAARLVLATWAGVYQEHRVVGLAPGAPRADAGSCLEREGALLAPSAADDAAAAAAVADGESEAQCASRWLPGEEEAEAAAAGAVGDDARLPAASVHAGAELTASVSVSLSRSIMGAALQ